MIKQLIICIMLLLLIPMASADPIETKIVITECETPHSIDETLYIHGKLLNADGTEMYFPDAPKLGMAPAVYLILNGKKNANIISGTPYTKTVQKDGTFVLQCNFMVMGKRHLPLQLGTNTIQIGYDGKDIAIGKRVEYEYLPSKSEIVSVNAYKNPPHETGSTSALVPFVGYAKGFFGLIFFGSVIVAIGYGAYSNAIHDPQKKARSQENFGMLLKVLGAVIVFSMAVIFLAGM